MGRVDFREPAATWLAVTRERGGLLSVNHPIAGPLAWMHAMPERPPLVEVWHWSWLDLSWTVPLSWWRAWGPAAIPVGGRAAGGAGRGAIWAGRDGPVLLRTGDELVAVDADGTVLAGPDGPVRR